MQADESLLDLLRAMRRGELDRERVEHWCERLDLTPEQTEALVERALPCLQRWRERLREGRDAD